MLGVLNFKQVIKEMQMETALRFQLNPFIMAIIKNINTNKCWQGCGDKGTLIYCCSEWKLAQLL
jgi:hypothetical protein